MTRRCCCWVLVLVIAPTLVAAAEPVELVLWPGGAPGVAEGEKPTIEVQLDERIGRRVTKVTKPTLTVYKPAADKDTGAAVVICPGGGYHILALDLEGVEVARWLNDIGVTGVVLQYRVPRDNSQPKHAAPLQDAQRALRLTRQHASQWGLDPQKIGLLGFSAGGHLAAVAGTNYRTSNYPRVDEADDLSCRPDFLLLIYPAYLNAAGSTTELAQELPVDAETPPTLLVHAFDDGVPCTGSIAFFLALKNAGVASELHIYPSGGHGYGLRPSEHAVSTWPERAERWLQGIGMAAKQNP